MARNLKLKDLIDKIEQSLYSDELSLFVGAGLSRDSGYYDWKELLRKPAEELGLNVEKEQYDLISLAQYYCNSNKRRAIDDLLLTAFPANLKKTECHEILAHLPITTYWTTNYDTLIEDALKDTNKNVSIRKTDKDLQLSARNHDAIVYKMHGDIQTPSNAVITRDDYEEYGVNDRRLFRDVLEGNLLTKTFLFLGFGFLDPNFNFVLQKMRVLLGDHTREHYCIMKEVAVDEEEKCSEKRQENNYAKIKQELQIEDLDRYGIKVYLVKSYNEISNILRIILNRYKRKTIFISGSAEDYSPMKKEEAQEFIRKLSFRLVQNGYRIVNGYGKGIGSDVINGVTEYCYSNRNIKVEDCLTLMPFPLSAVSDESLRETWGKYRKEMISKCGIAIFMFGNKIKDDKLVDADGVLKEYEIAKEFGLFSLPLSFTGSITREIYKEDNAKECIVNVDESKFLSKYINVDENVEGVIKIINRLNSKGDY